MATTAKRGPKARPKSKPGAWDRPEREASHTKTGPGRKAKASAQHLRTAVRDLAPLTMAAPVSRTKLRANVGGNRDGFNVVRRRIWREGEPVHIVKPVRAARLAAIKAKQAEAA